MTARDAATLDFYAAEAQAYAGRSREAEHARIAAFAAALPAGARVLELGCGGGHDSVELLARGLDLVATDGSPELAEQASLRIERPVAVLLFEDIDAVEAFDGVWANACLLHVPRIALPGILGRIHAALKPGGVFYASYKAGTREGRDSFGRYFNYPSPDWLRGAYGESRWQTLTLLEDLGGGYDGEPTRWLHATAVKRL